MSPPVHACACRAMGVCVCMHMCYVDCTRAPSYDRLTGVHFAMWCVQRRLICHAPQADANKRASADSRAEAKAEGRRGPGRPRRELPADVSVAIEAMTGAAEQPSDPNWAELFGGSQPGTPRDALPSTPIGAPAPCTPVAGSTQMAPPPPPLMRASTQVVVCSVLHSYP